MPAASEAPSERPLRRDAERNRRLILAAARDTFATNGLHVTLDEIARRAGVGVGTVYRRFTDKENLIDALFEDALAEVVALAEAASLQEDPWTGFVQWFEAFVEMQAKDRGLKEILLTSPRRHQRLAAARERMIPLVTRIIKRAQAAGELRPDLRPTDIPFLGQMIAGVADSSRDVSPDLFRRYAAIVLDGLRVRRDAPTRLPVRALSLEQLEITQETE